MKTDKRLKDERRGHTIMTARRSDEWPRELVHRNEAERKQAPQSEANVCRKCNLEKKPL